MPTDRVHATPSVAFQGAPGAFSEEAVHAYFGPRAAAVPCREFAGVGAAVAEGRAEFGVLPIENSVAGSVVAAYDVLAGGALRIVGEVVRPIRHCVLGVPGASVGDVRRILSHPVALAQCTRYLAAQPAEAVAVYDTAGAAQEVAERGDATVAAIAGRGAAERYGLAILAEDVQDRADNQTRFLVVVRTGTAEAGGAVPSAGIPAGPAPPDAGARPTAAPPDAWHSARTTITPPDAAAWTVTPATAGRPGAGDAAAPAPYKTAILLETEDRPGALLDVLHPLAAAGLNLRKLESRPGKLPWRYRFFLEVEADARRPDAAGAIEEVRRRATMMRVLGSFPASR